MAIPVEWYNEDRTMIIQRFGSGWTFQDVIQMMDETADLLDTISHRAAVISDLSQSKTTPNLSVGALQRIANHRLTKHPNLIRIYMIGVQTYVRVVVQVFARMFPAAFKRYQLADTTEAVEKTLAHELAKTPEAAEH
jgi:hypothetical protein